MGLAETLDRLMSPPWSLVSQDDGTEISGQFPPQNLRENVSGTWSEASTLGLPTPVLQFVKGDLETIQVDLKIFSKHRGLLGTGIGADDVEERIAQMRDAARADPDLGRPHVWLFSVGTQFSQTVVIRTVGGIRYDRMIPQDGGVLRGAMFTLDMARYVPYSVTDLTAQAESLVTPARTGETYEHIARRVHGDPLLGEALRRRNPDRRILEEGDLVHVPNARKLRGEVLPLTPQSLFLQRGKTAQRDNLVTTFSERGEPKPTHVLLEDW